MNHKETYDCWVGLAVVVLNGTSEYTSGHLIMSFPTISLGENE